MIYQGISDRSLEMRCENHNSLRHISLGFYIQLEALRQCIPSPRHVLPVLRSGLVTGSPPNFNRLFTGPLPTLPINFLQIRSHSFCAKLLTDRQTDKQTNRRTTTITYPPWRR